MNEPLTDADVFLFPNSGKEYVVAKKGAGAADITVTTPRTVDGPRGCGPDGRGRGQHGPADWTFDPAVYNNSDGKVALEFSAVTNLSIAVLRV